MKNQLNYYSRYNRIKVQDKKAISSLYSLLSINTLNKLAFDATVSLQMISLHKKEKLYHSLIADGQGHQSEYLQANNLMTFRSFQSQSVDKKKNLSSQTSQTGREKVKLSRKKTKLNEFYKEQNISKQVYLENLVREVRQKSRQRVKSNEDKTNEKKKKKNRKSLIKNSREKNNNQPVQEHFQNKRLKASVQLLNQQLIDSEAKTQETNLKLKDRKVITSLLSQTQRKNQDCQLQNKFYENKQEYKNYDNEEDRKQYVESIDDGIQKQEQSGPSVVLERLNFKIDQISANLKQHIKERINNKLYDSESKQDNPSSNNQKSSEIKSFSKEHEKITKPTKNFIEVQLFHSQSEIWKPTERSLQITFRQVNIAQQKSNETQTVKKISQLPLYSSIEKSSIQQRIDKKQTNKVNQLEMKQNSSENNSSTLKKQLIEQQIKDIVQRNLKTFDKVNPIINSFHITNSHTDEQYFSQINHKKFIEDIPDQHPLQLMSYQKLNHKANNLISQVNVQVPFKKSFKKFILNKELNPRLVTSTILNDKNIKFAHLLKQKITNQMDQNRRKTQQTSNQKQSEKINFKKLIKKKRQCSKQEDIPHYEQTNIPLNKLQNQKLLVAFFNNN